MKQGYSQSFEEHYILEYFIGFKGRFLEIGSNDGITLSNCRALAESGWEGACIEPSPKAFVRLQENYKGFDKISRHQKAIITIDEKIVLFESGPLLGDKDVALVSSVIEKEMDRFPDVEKHRVMVEGVRWETFYQSIGRPKFDFISLDAEGEDWEILQQMNLEEIGVRLYCIEWNLKEDVKKQFVDYMKGFKVIYQSAENLLFAK